MNHFPNQPHLVQMRRHLLDVPHSKSYGYKIYSLSDKGQLFYVGCTHTFLFQRLIKHFGCAKRGSPHPLYIKIKSLLDNGEIPTVGVLEYIPSDRELALKAERRWIVKMTKEKVGLLNKFKVIKW